MTSGTKRLNQYPDTGAGRDAIVFQNVTFDTTARLNTGSGEDDINLLNRNSSTFEFLNLEVDSGADDDVMSIERFHIVDSLSLSGGAGTDEIFVSDGREWRAGRRRRSTRTGPC